ncbi:MAG: phosphoribosylformylglycinamidine synthase subunit PurL [Candidatus Omnitrophica bacterium]|nr:phosphoribosylformylglycinamidine synthase subunit PurL [Candidatus Omnitrophota bacterium]
MWRIEIYNKPGISDPDGEGVRKSILDLGIQTITKVELVQVYHLEGEINQADAEKISRELLVDSVTQQYSCRIIEGPLKISETENFHVIEIAHNPGVMDPVEHSAIKGIKDLGISGIRSVRAARQYRLNGALSSLERGIVVDKVLSNKLIQHVVDYNALEKTLSLPAHELSFKLAHVDLLDCSDKELLKLSRDGQLFLNLKEMQTIQKYFKKLGRNPTDCELETIAQTWSEHCYHKTFRGDIRYQYTDKGKKKTKLIHSLLKSTIVKATKKLNKPWCVSVFHDNAGVIKFDEKDNVCFKVETHNHPSALEPFGGANTGIGGVIRDILGTGLGAKPICNTDVFCFAPPDMAFEDLPEGALHPKRVMKGVVSGVRDYGNKMGIPTVNGAILFDKKFVGNPLVYCGTVGIMPKDKVYKKTYKGDYVVVVGGKTGRDGIHGATFSSGELTTESETVSSGAVQIGDPIQEKKVLDALLKARDLDLYTAITDCGAGGLSSAVGEMGKELGARIDLDKVPLKYAGLNYDEIWISESQERMVLSVESKDLKELLSVFTNENVEATVIGEFTGSGRLELFYHVSKVCDLDMAFLHDGTPKIVKEARWAEPKLKDTKIPCPSDLNQKLLEVFSHYNVCSKEWVIRQYDHEVQGASVIKPLVGITCDGPSDASVIAPKLDSKKGIAISNGINVQYGKIDPYWMAMSCVDEAIRQIISVGGTLDKIAILDNFCWGNPDKPDRLGGLVRCALGCYDAAVKYGVPFISGKDSLYNEYAQGNQSIAIPGAILISAMGIVPDVTKMVTMDFKCPGNLIYAVGKTDDEWGGSIYLDTYGLLGSAVPKPDPKQAVKIFEALSKATHSGVIRSMHDCSEGGLAVALAEMAFSGNVGAEISLKNVRFTGKQKRNDMVLFAESNSRFVVEVEPKNQKRFEKLLSGLPWGLIGQVSQEKELSVIGLNGESCLQVSTMDLKQAWQKPLKF